MIRAKIYDTSRAKAIFCRGAAIMLLAGFFGTANAVDFKGVELGGTLWASTERLVFGDLDCNPLKLSEGDYQDYILEMQGFVPGVRQVCVAETSIATVPADATIMLGQSRRVLRLTFQFAGQSYPLVLKAMSDKWGEGVHEVRGEGDESMWWDFSDGSSVSLHHTPAESEGSDSMASVGLAEYSISDL